MNPIDIKRPATETAVPAPVPDTPGADRDYWHALITADQAASFLGFVEQTLRGLRYKGGGPKFVRLSARAIRYRRIDLKVWADERMRSSTSDTSNQAA